MKWELLVMLDYRPRGRATIANKWLAPKKTDKILNVGCANGFFEKYYLIGKVKRIEGIDINENKIAYAKSITGLDCFKSYNGLDFPFNNGEFKKILL